MVSPAPSLTASSLLGRGGRRDQLCVFRSAGVTFIVVSARSRLWRRYNDIRPDPKRWVDGRVCGSVGHSYFAIILSEGPSGPLPLDVALRALSLVTILGAVVLG
jgi:hypothetical protein